MQNASATLFGLSSLCMHTSPGSGLMPCLHCEHTALIDGNQTITVWTVVIRPSGSQLTDLCRLEESVMHQPDVISFTLSLF